ncbi:MAG: hypothetical protein COZ80_07410 [Ignavibacteria bacterium CG_4_8_14_3_um_filter_37_9]|nr:hypothetical protein [Ignavibacteria bacterium]OIO18353.1 MAG: hypothetical protein AUJ54_08270 [Ignavibacteria bacterium CG1_02_37_35]PIP79444.1 MAG: hypothetical protein COW85_01120 [Ignavibacteria bacterium CG22_combo_CG10-13_8_21_14_all_37_15]PIS44538.1 MAG: hypothetical protein COT22_09995 [Ignavibacteria bacterium CG08_land_8_20_14_0_20_37_9]PIW99055.1 MAG: hypothetical protein COZ80_07410 [Ignavibacteria bacterium CG_4_8_14_3_um_filter_37_9]PIX94980.1 MAG: hypothetical protein COZ25_
MKLVFVWLLFFVVFVGCSTEKSIKQGNGILSGEQLYKEKCGGCHALYQRDKFKEGDWDSVIVRMEKKARLDDNQSKLIREYLVVQSDSLKNRN